MANGDEEVMVWHPERPLIACFETSVDWQSYIIEVGVNVWVIVLQAIQKYGVKLAGEFVLSRYLHTYLLYGARLAHQ